MISQITQIDYNDNVPTIDWGNTMSVQTYLRSRHIPFEVLLHAPAPSATRLAQSVHVPGQRVAKTVLMRASDRFVLAVLPATHRIDMPKLMQSLGTTDVRIASEQDLNEVFVDCELGATPPFGRLYGISTIVDSNLAGGSEIVFEGNTRHEGVRMRYRDYEAVEAPVRARFATPIDPPRKL
jgi:Ala-tRNA(Pro) deacylase